MIRRVVIAGLLLSPSAVAAADRIAGPVTFAIALLGVAAAGPALMLGGRIDSWARRLTKLALALALVLLAANLLSNLIKAAASIS